MLIYNKEKFFNQMSQYRFFEQDRAFYVENSVDVQIVQINSPNVYKDLSVYSGYNCITLTEQQYGDGIHSSSLIAKFGDDYLFSVNHETYDIYHISGTSLTSFVIPVSATASNKLLRIDRNFILYPNSITAECD
jgi:hypothetical protein